jgi:putative two-component system response regulator
MEQRHILIIDDHRVIAEGCKHYIIQAGLNWKVHWSATVASAGVLSEFDLAILDLRLADRSSPADNIAELMRHGVPVMVYTSAEDPMMVRNAVSAGVYAVVRKSSSSEEFIDAATLSLSKVPSAGLDWASALDTDTDFVREYLTSTEQKVLRLYAMGNKAFAVARELGLSKYTVDTYIARIRSKYRSAGRSAETRIELFKRAAEDGLISYFE